MSYSNRITTTTSLFPLYVIKFNFIVETFHTELHTLKLYENRVFSMKVDKFVITFNSSTLLIHGTILLTVIEIGIGLCGNVTENLLENYRTLLKSYFVDTFHVIAESSRRYGGKTQFGKVS